jgi:hypothetical protein
MKAASHPSASVEVFSMTTNIKPIDVSTLTTEDIGEGYFRSLSNVQTRKNHVLLSGVQPALPLNVIQNDFSTWYAGFCSLARMLNAQVNLPPIQEMIAYVGENFDRARAALAA